MRELRRGWTVSSSVERRPATRRPASSPASSKPWNGSPPRLASATSDDTTSLEVVIFGVLADYTSDMDWIDEAGAKLATALRDSGLLR